MSPACVQDSDREHPNCHLFDDVPESGNPASCTKNVSVTTMSWKTIFAISMTYRGVHYEAT